ncbi:acyltransferase family protein [Terrisporobacter vanillatitrophus]|uniref:acyltransferase family protein n=1 Tax=Terrisporobacter vanillatitrophus TaxID=3058402 RepID=UPI003EB92B7B
MFSNFEFEYALSYYSPIFALGIYIMACEKGKISKILSNDILQKIAVFSFEFYMVHELILIIFRRVFKDLTYHWLIKNIIISIPALIISILIAIVLNRYITKNVVCKSISNREKVYIEI